MFYFWGEGGGMIVSNFVSWGEGYDLHQILWFTIFLMQVISNVLLSDLLMMKMLANQVLVLVINVCGVPAVEYWH